MPHNPRHKKRYDSVPRTSASPFVNRFNLPVNKPKQDDELSIIEQIIRLRKKTEQELARRQLAQEGRIQENSQRQRAQVMRRKVYEDMMADLEAGTVAPPPAARVPLDHGQDDPPEGAYDGRFDTGSTPAAIRGMLEEGERMGRVTERAEAGVPARGEFDHLAVQPTSREMIAEASKKPLYVTDDGEPIFMEDVVALGGAARLRAISRAAKPIQEAFFKMIHKLKLDRHRAGKPPISAAKVADKVAVPAAAAATAAGLGGAAQFLGEGESFIPTPPTDDAAPAEDFDLLRAISEGGISLSPGSASQIGVDEVAKDLIQKRVQTIKEKTLPDSVLHEDKVTQQSLLDPLDEVTRGGPVRGPLATIDDEAKVEEAEGTGTETQVAKVAQEDKSTVGGSENLPDETRAALERTWGKWTYNPRQRRDRYMDQLNSIYRKGAWLDAIAALSGNPSRSGAFIQRAVAKMEAMQMFDQEERIYNIWRDVYFASDGTYDPPANKAEAAKRARRLGASPQEVKKIYGWTEEEPDLQQWYRVVDGELETTRTKGKKTEPDGEGWIMGTPPAGLQTETPVSHINWTDGDRTITLEKGQTPQSVGHTGDWYKGKSGESDRTRVASIDFSENAYQNAIDAGDDDETARAKAAELLFLRFKQDPEMYLYLQGMSDPDQRESARLKINNIIDDYLKRKGSYSAAGQRGTTTTTTINMGAVD